MLQRIPLAFLCQCQQCTRSMFFPGKCADFTVTASTLVPANMKRLLEETIYQDGRCSQQPVRVSYG